MIYVVVFFFPEIHQEVFLFYFYLPKLRTESLKEIRMMTFLPFATIVSLYYGTVMGMYFRPLTSYSLKDAVITMMYIAVTPMLNPFIYTLRNRVMKDALEKLFSNRTSSHPT